MQTTKTTNYDWSLLNNRDISNKYKITLGKKFSAFLEISETLIPNDEYENFVNTHMEEGAECIQSKQRDKHKVPWETLAFKK